jgi:hypothetical protein
MRRPDFALNQAGFSIVEMLISVTVMLTVTAAVFSLVNPTQGTFQAQPEVSDLQQRLRVGTDALGKDMVMAGGGSYSGANPMALSNFLAPVMPFRWGLIGEDPPATFKTDTITLQYVPPTNAQTSIGEDMPQPSAELKVSGDPGCPMDPGTNQDDPLCGFEEEMNVLIYDDTGTYDRFTITNVQEDAQQGGHLQHNQDNFSKSYSKGSKIVRIDSHTYYLRTDLAAQTYQLMHYDGTRNPDVPVVDNVVSLQFQYYGDPQPPIMKKVLTDPTGPWTTYGPKPSAAASGGWAAGENCVFANDGSPIPAPKLPVLGAGGATTGLVELTAATLTDGPFCPNNVSARRYDADLLRVRKIMVTIRVQSASDVLRGPAGALFRYGGTATQPNRWVPDQEYRFEVSPRNLNLGR